MKTNRYTIAFNMGKRRRKITLDAFSFEDGRIKIKNSYGMGCDKFKLVHREVR
jgi:hypothetical protein